MQDEFHAEPTPETGEPLATSNGSSEPADSSETASSTSESPTTARPAATASSYRDIIAERLARKGSGATPTPLAHASDVERSVPTAPPMEAPTAEIEMPAEIEAATKMQEIPSGEGTGTATESGLSSRERALMRQQERAALRRGASRRPRPESEPAIGEELPPESSGGETAEESAKVAQDVIAARLAKKPQQRGEREPREGREPRAERPERGDRSGRGERPERRENRREERQPRQEERPERPQREVIAEAITPQLELTPRSAQPPRERDELRKREPSRTPASTSITPKPEEKGAPAATQLATKLGISVVIPLYNEQESLRELTAALKQQCMRLAGPKYEILFVNDGSTDRSGEILQDILATSSRVTAITFRRNLGKSAALAAGFAEAQYGIVITMDADLQDDPREFVNLIAKLAEGYDLVSGWKKKRHDPMSKTGPSKFFNWVTSFFSGIRLHDFNCGLKAYRKEVTDSLQVYGELHRYLPALAYWQGFRVTEIPVTHHPRKFGKSKFGSSRFFKGFLDLLSIVFTNRYGKRPLHLFGTIGTLMAIAGFIIDIWLTVEWALGLTSLSNRPLLLLGLLLILVGAQLISIGLLGEMIVKNSISRSSISYAKEKGRPSAEARERRASRAARISRVGGRGDRRNPRRS